MPTDTRGVFNITEAMQAHMRGRSWRDEPECPRFHELRLLCVRHRGFDGAVHDGELIVHAQVADEVFGIFERLFQADFPLHSVRRVDHFEGDDGASMAANNCSGFNFRRIDGTQLLSHHARGLAVDINPVQNPWLREGRVDPALGRDYLDRTVVRPGMIVRPGLVIALFSAAGWRWGGESAHGADYHHFDKP